MHLTPGERAVRCLCGQAIDRVPFGVGLGWYPWGQTIERWRAESGDPELDPAALFGFDASFVNPACNCGYLPPFEYETLEETEDYLIYRDERGIVGRRTQDAQTMSQYLDYPVKTTADWERLKGERLQPGPERVSQDWPAFRARLAARGEAVQVGSYPWGAFGTARDVLGVERLLMGFYESPELIRDIMDTFTSLWIDIYEQVAAQVQIDHLHIWEDMSGKQGSLLSPRMVEEFMMPAYDRLADCAARHGIRVMSVDTDGDCAELVPVMRAHGVNAFMPFEVQAGNDLRDYREQYPDLGLIGGLDKRALARGRKEIDAEVAKAAEVMRAGRYIPCFDHHIPPDVPWDNFRYAAERIKELCYSIVPERV
jgi:uroporphyrinogen decarboxylase